jgi:hypothetical protein
MDDLDQRRAFCGVNISQFFRHIAQIPGRVTSVTTLKIIIHEGFYVVEKAE